jgi:hypothetical protein
LPARTLGEGGSKIFCFFWVVLLRASFNFVVSQIQLADILSRLDEMK